MLRRVIAYRHGQSWSNFLKDDALPDPSLTVQGMFQAVNTNYPADLVLVSPLMRTMQTAQLMFGLGRDVPTVALDCLTEYPHTDPSNRPSSLRELRRCFPHVNYSMLASNSPAYIRYGTNSEDYFNHQSNEFVRKLALFEDKRNIAVVGHSTWIHSFMRRRLEVPETELEHSRPYELFD